MATRKKTPSNTISTSKTNEYKVFAIKLVIIVTFLAVLLFLYKISNIVIILFFSLFLNILFSPLLNKFKKWKIPDIIGIIIIYILVFLFLLITVFAIIPIFVNQFSNFSTSIQTNINAMITTYNTYGLEGFNLPDFVKSFIEEINIAEILNSIKNNIGEISSFIGKNFKAFLSSGAGILSSITSAIANLFLVFVFTFFISLERENIRDFFYKIIPTPASKYLLSREQQIINNISDWFKSQGILGLCIFILTFIGLNILKLFGVDLEDTFTLALIAGLMEFVPYVGPVLAAIPAIIIALGISYKAAIIVVILYIIIQQAENNILVPYVMGKSLSLSPFAVLIAMTIGASLFGIIGIIIAVPVVAVIQIFIKDYLNNKK